MEEKGTVFIPDRRLPELDPKDERNVSWRVPNSPKQHEFVDDASIVKTEAPKERSVSTPTERTSTSNPSSPAEGRKFMRIAKTSSDNSSDEPRSSTNKLWRHLFAGVTRCVDELYAHCEEQDDKTKCQEVIDLLKRSRLDFKKLNERIDEQSNFRQGQALSWDIRKPTLPSPNNSGGGYPLAGNSNGSSHATSPVAPELMANERGAHSPVLQEGKVEEPQVPEIVVPKAMALKKLNPEAKPFNPSVLPPTFPSPPATALSVCNIILPSSLIDPAVAPMLPPAVTSLTAAKAPSAHRNPTHTNKGLPKMPALIPIKSLNVSGGASGLRSLPPGLGHTDHGRSLFGAEQEADLEDARLQAEVQQASEQIWAAAEAWVEAEAEAEESEWQMLALGIKSYLHTSGSLSDYEEEPLDYSRNLGLLGVHSTSISATNSPKQFPGLGASHVAASGDTALVSADWANTLLLSPEQRAIWEEKPASRFGSRHPSNSAFNRSRTGSKSNLAAHNTPKASKKGVSSPHMTIETASSPSPSDYSPAFSAQSPSYLSPGPGRSSYRSPSNSPTDAFIRAGGTPASGGRSLHDKLSSPERKKARSPTELQRRYEERHTNAEILRDKSVAERVQKASIASLRVKQAEEREALRISERKQKIEEKQLSAQERLQANLRSIQARANNEHSKVNLANLKNAMKKETMAQLLEEAETRVLTANTRKQERLQNVTLDQKRRNARKVPQLSEWRLQHEQENMERWNKLQLRLDSIAARRAARLVELQRRAEENALLCEANERLAEKANDTAPSGPVMAVSPTKASFTSELISELKKGVVSAQKAAKLNPSVKNRLNSSPRTTAKHPAKKAPSPSPASKSPELQEDAAPEDAAEQRSKSKVKREKRKLKAQMAEQALLSEEKAIQEAIALNNASKSTATVFVTATTASRKDAGKSMDIALADPILTPAELYVRSLHSFQPCAHACLEEGFAAAKSMMQKKINAAAKLEVARSIALTDATGTDVADSGGGVLNREYTTAATEATLLDCLEIPGASVPNLLALAVKDLLTASVRTPTETAFDVPSSSLNMHVMQRLYVLLQAAPVSASPGKPLLSTSGNSTADLGSSSNSSASSCCGEGLVSEVLLLRLLFGPEVGVLHCAAEYTALVDAVALLHCSHNPLHSGCGVHHEPALGRGLAVSQELEVKAEVWKLVFDLLVSIAATAEGLALMVQSGLATVLVDVLHVLLRSLELSQGAAYPTPLLFVACNILHVLSRVLSILPSVGAIAVSAVAQSTLDGLVWYLFTSAQVVAVSDTLRSMVAAAADVLGATAPYMDFFAAASDYVASVGAFVGRSGGLGTNSASSGSEISGTIPVIDSVLQLSPTAHRHGKGRQLVSILRRAEVLQGLLGAMAELAGRVNGSGSVAAATSAGSSSSEQIHASKVAQVDHLVVLMRLASAAHSLVSADLSLVQGLTAEQQSLWVGTISSLLHLFHGALDGPAQTTFPVYYTGTGTGSVTTSECSKGVIEAALRSLLVMLGLSCLQNSAVQRLCGVADTAGVASGVISADGKAMSLLTQLCSFSPKYYKDKRFKHSVLPCLVTLCLDCDFNVVQLFRLGKLQTVLKYLDYSVKTHEIYLQQQARKKGSTVVGGNTATLTEEAAHVHRLSRLIPTDLWSIAVVTLSHHQPINK